LIARDTAAPVAFLTPEPAFQIEHAHRRRQPKRKTMRRSPGSLRRARLAGNFKGPASAPVELSEKLL
jgi:hypothetical protein